MPLQDTEPEVDEREAFAAELAGMLDAPPAKLKRNPLRRDQTGPQRAAGEKSKQEFARELEQLFPARETTAGEKVSVGAVGATADILQAPEIGEKLAKYLGVPTETISKHFPPAALYSRAAKALGAKGRELKTLTEEAEPFPAQDFKSMALRGLGSTAPLAAAGPLGALGGRLAGGAAARVLPETLGLAGRLGAKEAFVAGAERLGARAAVMGAGGAMTAVPMYHDVLAHTGDPRKAMVALVAGFGIGESEVIGVGGMFADVNKASGGTFVRALERMAAEGTDEPLQEWFSTGGQEIMTKALSDQKIRYIAEVLPKQGDAALIGAMIGAGVAGGFEAPGLARSGARALPGQPQQAHGAQGELTEEDVLTADVQAATGLQGRGMRLERPTGRGRGSRTVANIGPETAPAPKLSKEAEKVVQGKDVKLEELTPEVVQEIVQAHGEAARVQQIADEERERLRVEREAPPAEEPTTPAAPRLAPGEAGQPAPTSEADQGPAGSAEAAGVPISEERAIEHAKRMRAAAFRTPGFQGIEQKAMEKGLEREEVRALARTTLGAHKEMDPRGLNKLIAETDLPTLKARAAEIIARGEPPIEPDEIEGARQQLQLRESMGTPQAPPRTRMSDAVNALRSLVTESERADVGGDLEHTEALDMAERVLRSRGEQGVEATEIDAALEELVRASKLRPELTEETSKSKAQTAYTDAAIKHARRVLDVFDASKSGLRRVSSAKPFEPQPLGESAPPAEEGLRSKADREVGEPIPPEPAPKGLHSEEAKRKRAAAAEGGGLSAEDVPIKLATAAFYNTSHTPEARGKQVQQQYLNEMRSARRELAPLATDAEKLALLSAEFEAYRQGYLKRMKAWLAAHSRVASAMVTGPANFPVERNRKAGAVADKRLHELNEFQRRGIAAIRKKLTADERASALAERYPGRETREVEFDEGTIRLNAEADRIQLLFETKPSGERLRELRGAGFKWAPSVKAWQRQWTPNAEAATERLLGVKLAKPPVVIEKPAAADAAEQARIRASMEAAKKHDDAVEREEKKKLPAPPTMTAAQINKELDRLEAEDSKITDALIAAGRGSERPSDRAEKTDQLSVRSREITDRLWALRFEAKERYGPSFIGRLPAKGFGPRATPEFMAEMAEEREAREKERSAERAVEQAKGDVDEEALGIETKVDEDIDEQMSDGSVVADPGDLPNSMQGGFPADPVTGGGASPRAPIGDRLYGRLEIDSGEAKPGERVSAPQVIEQLSKVVAAAGGKTPIRWGRMGTVRARGFFRVAPEVIRVKTANNIATAAHEVGHALEKHVFGWEKGGPWVKPIASKAMQDELVKLGRALYGDTRPSAGYKREGFAEFIRLFVADHAKAAKDAPQFTAWFESEFAKAQPDVMTELLETRRLVTRWGEQGSLERARASTIDPASWGERWKKLKAKTTLFAFKRAWTEIGEAYHVFARESERKLGRLLEPTEDPFMLFQALRMTHSARVRRMVSSGMIDLWGNRTGPALDEIRSLVRGRFEDFSIFLWAKRAHALWNDPLKGERNPGLSREDALQIIADLSTPHFDLAADKVYQWQDGLLSYAAQASPSFRKVVDRVREVDPGSYIPLQREFDVLDSLWNETRSKTARYSGGGIVSALKGSGRRIKNPLQAMLANAERTVLAAHRRLILDATIKLGQIEGMGHMIEEVPKDKVPFSVDLEQVLRRLAEEKPGALQEGIEGPLALGDFAGEALTFFAPAQFPKGQDPVIPFWDGKQVRWYWVDHRLASALAGLDLARLPKAIDIMLGIPNRLFRAGTTGLRASFGLITNPIRDAPTFWINTRSRAWAPQLFGRYYAEFTKAAGAAVTGGKYESPYLEAFMNLGGAMATPLGPDSNEVQRAARELVQTGKWRYLDPRNWFEFYKDLVQFPETGTRAAELRNIAAEVGWRPGEPMSPNQALQMLLGAKQVTADFTAAGAIARVANQVAPFVGASIAGNRAAVRSAKRNPARYFFRGMQMAAATLLLWWQVKDEEWYIELKARSKFMFWHVPMRWQGRDEIVAVPRPFEIGAIFAALPEALADAWYRQEPEIASKWFAQFFETLNPLSLPAPIEEAAEQLANRDFFWDTPIVPTGELRRNPEEQVGDYTSRVAVFLGELFEASPRRIDHAIKGTMGGVAEDVVSVLGLGPTEKEREKEPADAAVIGRLFKRGGPLGTSQQSVDDLYEALEEAQAIQASKKRAETPEERNRRLLLEDAAEATSALGYVRTQTNGVDQRRKITEEIVKIARDALEEAAGSGRRGFAKAALGSAKARKKQAQIEQR